MTMWCLLTTCYYSDNAIVSYVTHCWMKNTYDYQLKIYIIFNLLILFFTSYKTFFFWLFHRYPGLSEEIKGLLENDPHILWSQLPSVRNRGIWQVKMLARDAFGWRKVVALHGRCHIHSFNHYQRTQLSCISFHENL